MRLMAQHVGTSADPGALMLPPSGSSCSHHSTSGRPAQMRWNPVVTAEVRAWAVQVMSAAPVAQRHQTMGNAGTDGSTSR